LPRRRDLDVGILPKLTAALSRRGSGGMFEGPEVHQRVRHGLREGNPLCLGLGGDVLAAVVGQPDLSRAASSSSDILRQQWKTGPAGWAQLAVVEVGANRALHGLLGKPAL